ncbi:hypothetical protein [Streptomyces katrae]|uniref:Tetratricopeptide repeat protein n=1 Tax=Streptomyces katrae TaxID=68223 RepID=A0A0F4JJF7_9ACTN|nr:hypothetical protein [Streptomyces katrae]KJY34462.1 hypothetical protein VR44_11880 [Streptomyces katrae]
MSTELSKARELLESGDPEGAMRTLRLAADGVASAEVAPLVARLAEGAGFTDLAEASADLAARPVEAESLYRFGYACVERGIPALAVPALREALRLSLASPPEPERTGFFRRMAKPRTRTRLAPRRVLLELVTALERLERHADALALLHEHDSLMEDWPDRYLTVYNALMAGRTDTARQVFDRLSEPEGVWVAPGRRVGRMLERAAALPPAGDQDLRGWHYALTGGLLLTLSPHGFDQGMTGRWAFLQDDLDSCRHGLERLRAVLAATGREPASVGLLPDRGSRALGLAASRLLGVPAHPYRPGTPDVLVVAYDLSACDPDTVHALTERAPGELLFEHATCWTETPGASADVCTLLVQSVTAPWEPGLRLSEDGRPERTEPDGRSAEELAEAILAADPAPPEGDGQTPDDPDAALAAFAARAAGLWADGPRDRIRSSGPVRSGRFA